MLQFRFSSRARTGILEGADIDNARIVDQYIDAAPFPHYEVDGLHRPASRSPMRVPGSSRIRPGDQLAPRRFQFVAITGEQGRAEGAFPGEEAPGDCRRARPQEPP